MICEKYTIIFPYKGDFARYDFISYHIGKKYFCPFFKKAEQKKKNIIRKDG